MEANIRGLESLGQSPIIFGKLPAEMRTSLTREHESNNWDIRSLREAIAKEMYIPGFDINGCPIARGK